MDPQVTWEVMLDALAAGDVDAAMEAAKALTDWLERDGFPPQPLTRVLSDDWDRTICHYVCRQVLDATRSREIDR